MHAKSLVVLAALAGAAQADPLTAFEARWPGVLTSLRTRHLDRLLVEGTTPCTAFDDTAEGPPIAETTPASLAPDGKTLIVLTTLDLDRAAATRLGVARGGMGVYLVAFDGPSGTIWAHALENFRSCNPNTHAFAWTADSRRVHVGTDTGHGSRVALVDVAGRAVPFEGFTSLDVASPNLQHIATLPWFSGFPVDERSGTPAVNGDALSIDDRAVWGSSGRNAARIWDVAWTSDVVLTFCGSTPRKSAAKFTATVRPHGPIAVKRVEGSCSPEP